jgi:hypothetical protein
MSRLIHDKIKQPLSNETLFVKLANGGSVLVETDDTGLQLNFSQSLKIEAVD